MRSNAKEPAEILCIAAPNTHHGLRTIQRSLPSLARPQPLWPLSSLFDVSLPRSTGPPFPPRPRPRHPFSMTMEEPSPLDIEGWRLHGPSSCQIWSSSFKIYMSSLNRWCYYDAKFRVPWVVEREEVFSLVAAMAAKMAWRSLMVRDGGRR
ncbi:hypothetical protein NL676_017911 [Syzygium grande]|nr:hypothetical protein NL676_017911 [Syzygium grande]